MSSSAGMVMRGDSGGGESGWAIGESRDPLSEAGGALVPRMLLTGGMAGGDTGGGGERRLLVGVGEEMVAGDMVCKSVKGGDGVSVTSVKAASCGSSRRGRMLGGLELEEATRFAGS